MQCALGGRYACRLLYHTNLPVCSPTVVKQGRPQLVALSTAASRKKINKDHVRKALTDGQITLKLSQMGKTT